MCEQDRLNFIIQRDGIDAAVDFARNTMKIYRKSVLRSHKRGYGYNSQKGNIHFASIPEFRRKFIESYCAFKKFVAQNG